MVGAGCPGAVPGGRDPAVHRPCLDGESVGPFEDESLFTFKPLRWCDSLYRRGWHKVLRECRAVARRTKGSLPLA